MGAQFEWDERKAALNLVKHRVSFEEAATVFSDTLSITIGDVRHSKQEARELMIGMSSMRRIVVVAFSRRSGIYRIISARVATRHERQDYEETE